MRTLEAGLSLSFACTCLGFALYVVDYPQLDAMRAAHVKKARMPHHAGIFRDEGFSRWRTNSYGLIGAEPASPRASDVYLIAVVGDSFVEALQVAPAESLNGLLQRSSRPLSATGASRSGTSESRATIPQCIRTLVHRPAAIRFDLAILTFNADDVFENEPAGAELPAKPLMLPDQTGA